MATVRLAEYMKDSILAALMERAFKAREEELDTELRHLGRMIYSDTYTPAERDLMSKLPPDFLELQEGTRVQFAGDVKWVSWGENRPVAAERKVRVYSANHKFTDKFRDIGKRRSTLEQEKKQARVEVNAKLKSVTTVGRLIEVWPEVAPFAERFLTPKKAAPLPVIQNDKLNAKFKLPVSPKEKARGKSK